MNLAPNAIRLAAAFAAFFAAVSGPAQAAQPSYVLGRANYLKFNCYSCHGVRAAGGMGPNIQGDGGDDVSEAVRTGADGGMPHYSQTIITNAEISTIGSYLQSIGTSNEPTFFDWWDYVPRTLP
jgi:mono/diheme cytochrome c family protein